MVLVTLPVTLLSIVTPQPATEAMIATAARALRDGRLVAFPTETVYGLGASARDDAAVAAIFRAKGRPGHNPLIVHVADADAAAMVTRMTNEAWRLARAFWPGPLTLVLPHHPDDALSPLVRAGGPTLAVRAPAHPVARSLLLASGLPLAAPSANRSGAVSPTTAAHVAAELGREPDPALAMILDGGPCGVGVESTVVDLTTTPPTILRPGGITREMLETALGGPVMLRTGPGAATPDTPGPPDIPLASPGLLGSHYAPRLPVRLNVTGAAPGEALLGFGGTPGATLDLSPAGDLAEAARNLFAMLRRLDGPPHSGIAVAPVPTHGLGLALNDRLARAAAPRPGSTH